MRLRKPWSTRREQASDDARPWVVCPNPFYQIYEGATLLAGARPWFVDSDPKRNFRARLARQCAEAVWAQTQLLFVCSPGNPAGAVMPLAEWQKLLFDLSDRHGFVIACRTSATARSTSATRPT